MEPTFSLDNKLLSKSLADTLNSFNSQLDERGNIMDDLKKRRGESINIPLPPAPDPVPEPVTPPLPPTNETEDIVNIANVIKQIFSNIDVEQKKFDEAELEAKRMAEAEAEAKRKAAEILKEDVANIVPVVNTIIDIEENAKAAEAKRKAAEILKEDVANIVPVVNEMMNIEENAKRLKAEEDAKLAEEKQKTALLNQDIIDIAHVVSTIIDTAENADAKRKAEEETIKKEEILNEAKRKAEENANKIDITNIINVLQKVVGDITKDRVVDDVNKTDNDIIQMLIAVVDQILTNPEPVQDDITKQKDIEQLIDILKQTLKNNVGDDALAQLMKYLLDNKDKLNITGENIENIKRVIDGSSVPVLPWEETDEYKKMQLEMNELQDIAKKSYEQSNKNIGDIKNLTNKLIEVEKDLATARSENTPEAKEKILQLEQQLQQATQSINDVKKEQQQAINDRKEVKASAIPDTTNEQNQTTMITRSQVKAKERLDQLVKEEKEAKQEYEKNIKSKQDIIDNLYKLKGEVKHAQIEKIIDEQELSNYNDIKKIIRDLDNSEGKIKAIQEYVTNAQDVEDATIRQGMIDILGEPIVNAAGAGKILTEEQISEVTTIVKKKIGLNQKIKENTLIIAKDSVINRTKDAFLKSLSQLNRMVTPEEEKMNEEDKKCNIDPNYMGKIIVGEKTIRLFYDGDGNPIKERNTCIENKPDNEIVSQ